MAACGSPSISKIMYPVMLDAASLRSPVERVLHKEVSIAAPPMRTELPELHSQLHSNVRICMRCASGSKTKVENKP